MHAKSNVPIIALMYLVDSLHKAVLEMLTKVLLMLINLINLSFSNLTIAENHEIRYIENCINEIQNNYTSTDFLIYINFNEKYAGLQLNHPAVIQNELKDLKYFKEFKATFYVLVLSEEYVEDVFSFLVYSHSWNPRAKFVVVLEKPCESLFTLARKFYVYDILVLISKGNIIQINTYFPFALVPETEISACQNGSLQNLTDLFPNKLPDNWKNTTVRAAMLTYPPYVIKKYGRIYGMEVELFETIQDVLQFNVVFENKPFRNWGRRLKNGSYAGGYSYLRNYEIDLVMGFFYCNRNEYWDFDLTYPYMEDNAKWVVPTAKVQENWRGVINIFKKYTWMLIVISFVFIAISLWLLAARALNHNLHKRISNCLLLCYKCFLGQCVDLPTTGRLRLALGVWIYCGFLFTAAFQGRLISVLNIKTRKKQISTLEELFKAKIKFGFYDDSRYLFGNSEDKLDKYVYNNYVSCPIDYYCLNRTAFKGDFATFKPKKLVEYLISTRAYLDQDGSSLFYLFKSNIYNVLVSLPFVRGFPMYDKVNTLLSHMRPAGFIDFYYKKSLYYAEKAIKAAEKKSLGFSQLKVTDVFWTFHILIFGLGVALVVFIIEIVWHRRKRTKKTKLAWLP